MKTRFDFEGYKYSLPIREAIKAYFDKIPILLPDGRYVEPAWIQELPPFIKEVTLLHLNSAPAIEGTGGFVSFEFEGESLILGNRQAKRAHDESLPIKLPDGRYLRVTSWLEVLPPIPHQLEPLQLDSVKAGAV